MWHSIDTAPQDGTPVLLYIRDREVPQPIVIGSYIVQLKVWQIQHNWDATGVDVHLDGPVKEKKGAATHWMPLPPPPTEPVTEGSPPNPQSPALREKLEELLWCVHSDNLLSVEK